MASNLKPPLYGLSFGGAIQTIDSSKKLLSTLSLDENEFFIGDPAGTLIGTISGITVGSILMLESAIIGAVQLHDNTVIIGNTPAQASGPFNIILVENLNTASNSPNITTISIRVQDRRPTIISAPDVMGTPYVGNVITAIDAIWNGAITDRLYQWKVDGVNGTGAGATTLTYTPVLGDLGKILTITVIAINSGGASAPSTSPESDPVLSAVLDVLQIALKISVCSIPVSA